MMTTPSGASFCNSSRVSAERIFSGWCNDKPAANAAAYTGEGETTCPRPRGRSGWLMTPTIWKSGCARSRFSVGTANCGVPQDTMRMAHPLRRLPLALFLELLDFAFDEVAFQ